MSSFSPAERETVMQIDDESNLWSVHTYQGKIMTKLKKAGIEPTETYPDGGAKYVLDYKQVSFRSGKKKEVSEETKIKRSLHMKNMQQNMQEKRKLNAMK